MEFFEAVEQKNWKQLSWETRKQLMNQLVMFYVSPLSKIDSVTPQEFACGGVKTETFEVSIDGVAYIFIPRAEEVILGWDQGHAGIRSHELLEGEKPAPDLPTIDTWINQHTSPLRKVTIPAMFVEKEAMPVGCERKGRWNCITGELVGDQAFYQRIAPDFLAAVQPELSPEESLSWTYPKVVSQENVYWATLDQDGIHYLLYAQQAVTYEEQVALVDREIRELPSVDEWEYLNGAGTRRLFRWGNQLRGDSLATAKDTLMNKIHAPNMFGLRFDPTQTVFELTDRLDCLKGGHLVEGGQTIIERFLPYSAYFVPDVSLSQTSVLNPAQYQVRRVIRIIENP